MEISIATPSKLQHSNYSRIPYTTGKQILPKKDCIIQIRKYCVSSVPSNNREIFEFCLNFNFLIKFMSITKFAKNGISFSVDVDFHIKYEIFQSH